MGERSDTIIIFRVDPSASRVAVLSFPRDLYVTIAGVGQPGPDQLGVRAQRPATVDRHDLRELRRRRRPLRAGRLLRLQDPRRRRRRSGGAVPVPGPRPEHRAQRPDARVLQPQRRARPRLRALAPLRVRGPAGQRELGGGPDVGPRAHLPPAGLPAPHAVQRAWTRGRSTPRVARALIKAATQYVVTDSGLSPAKLLEFAGVLNDVEPAGILTYQIESSPREVNGADVLEPQIEGENMQAVLAMFRGETSLAEAPTQVFAPTTTAPPRPSADGATCARSGRRRACRRPRRRRRHGAPGALAARSGARTPFGIVSARARSRLC